MVLVADLHLGKEATFRHHGIAVPDGGSAKTLRRLSRVLADHEAQRLTILGDLFHAKSSLSQPVIELFSGFLAQHDAVEVTLVRGNHDIHTGRLPAAWKLVVIDPPVTIDGVVMTHFPQPSSTDDQLCLSGHLHPAVRLPGDLALEGKFPCFWLASNGCLTLPAFGEFVGTARIDPQPGDRVWLTIDETVVELPVV
jgi:DNA ligase-associated metallophosphoesterase